MSMGRSFILAAIIGITVSLVANGSKVAFTDYRPETDEWFAYALMAAFPFAVLAAWGFRERSAWVCALVLTVVAYGAYLIEGIPQLATEGHIDMGLGFLVMTAPAWIAVVSVIVGLLARSLRPAR